MQVNYGVLVFKYFYPMVIFQFAYIDLKLFPCQVMGIWNGGVFLTATPGLD